MVFMNPQTDSISFQDLSPDSYSHLVFFSCISQDDDGELDLFVQAGCDGADGCSLVSSTLGGGAR